MINKAQGTVIPFFILLLLVSPAKSQQLAAANTSNDRDDKAVAEAVNGWWAASMKTHDQRIGWWREAKFGCFIHWGVYSTFGGEWKGKAFRGYAEHMMRSQKIPRAEYVEKVVSIFNPAKFDADEWVRLIKSAGMKYLIITAKHHDGFAMYPSEVTRYNIRDVTPFTRDPMRELAEACRKHGIKFGFYYSHAIDWEHPNGPGNDWDYSNPGGDRQLHGGAQWFDLHPEMFPRIQSYVNEKAIPQILELLKVYKPDILWFDTPSRLPLSENIRILKIVREADPNVVVNGRLARGRGHSFGDYKNTGDRAAEIVPTEGDWETIPTTNESYGYHKHDASHKPASHFIQLMAKAAARGGNVLMNIGPMGDGLIDLKDAAILREIGKWLEINGSSIYSTQRTPLPVQAWGESTVKGNKLFLHVFDWPSAGELVVGGLKNEVAAAYLLADTKRKALRTRRFNNNDVTVRVPRTTADKANTVVVLELKGDIQVNPVRLLSPRSHVNVLRSFDGELHGGGLRFGDGKAPRAYVFEWRDLKEWIGWQVRVNEAVEYEVAVKYTTTSNENRGSFAVSIGQHVLQATVVPTRNENESTTVTLGRVKLLPGKYDVSVKPVEIKGGELMRLFQVTLTPVSANSPAESPLRRVFLLNAEHLNATRNRIRRGDREIQPALSKLKDEAQKALSAGPFSVTTKTVTPPSGDKRDYMSQAPYFWPDPKSANGLPYIRRDGERNPEIDKINNHRVLDEMRSAVETLALDFYLTGNQKSAAKATELLRVFFLNTTTRMNPNLEYGQGIPGINTGRGIGLIETRGLTRIVDSVGLLAGSEAWTSGDQRGMEDWFRKFLQWMLESKHGRDESAAKNNHGTYYDLQVVSFALFLNQTERAGSIVEAAKQKRIATQIEPDGRQPLELARTRAWSYSVGNLDGLMLLARIGENTGVDLWNYQTPDGRSIRKALDFLIPFAFGEKKWTHQQLGNWPPQMLFPLIRRAAEKYSDSEIQSLLARLPPVDVADILKT